MAAEYGIETESLTGAAVRILEYLDGCLSAQDTMLLLNTCSMVAYGPAPDFLIPYVERMANSPGLAEFQNGALVRILGLYAHKMEVTDRVK